MTPGWHDGRLVAFDVETTGVDPNEARIVTAAIAACGGGVETQMVELMADPGVAIPDEAAAVHGVTTERAQAEGQPAAEVIATVLNTLAAYLNPGCPLVVFNARYDLTVLDREARRHGRVPLQERVALRVIDPLVIDKHLDRFRRGSRKLDAMCEHYKAVLEDAHAAGADALAAARVAWVIGARGAVVRRADTAAQARERAVLVEEWERVRGDLDLLHAAQIEWAHDQAVGLADYFRSQGNPDADSVEVAWPLVLLPGLEAAA